MKQFLLPDPGEGLVEAEIVSWRVQPGDQVAINDVVVEVETSKSIVELPSPYAGTVKELLVPEGQLVEVGTPIISIDDGTAASDPPADQDQDGERVANLVGYGPKASSSKRRPRKSGAAASNPPQAAPEPPPAAPTAPAPTPADSDLSAPTPAAAGERPLAKPPVRKLAKDRGVDLTTITGTGADGVITRSDVETAATPVSAAPSAGTVAAAPPDRQGVTREDVRVPIKGVRKATAQAMVNSAFTAPHVTEWVTCDVTATMELVQTIKARREFSELKVTPLLIIAKACLVALQTTPAMNAGWHEKAQEIVYYGGVNLGIAAATPRGLVVPNIKDADRMSLRELAEQMAGLIKTARDGRIQPADTSGGTFTITNVGTFGVDAGTPILNPGESGILAVGAINRRPWVVGSGAEERIEPRWVTTLAVSFDHRVVDGGPGSQFLADVADILGDPGTALLW